MIAAAREIREWAASLIAEYVEAVRSAAFAPATVKAHIVALLESHEITLNTLLPSAEVAITWNC